MKVRAGFVDLSDVSQLAAVDSLGSRNGNRVADRIPCRSSGQGTSGWVCFRWTRGFVGLAPLILSLLLSSYLMLSTDDAHAQEVFGTMRDAVAPIWRQASRTPAKSPECRTSPTPSDRAKSYFTTATYDLWSAYRSLGYLESATRDRNLNARIYNWMVPCTPGFLGALAAAVISRLDLAWATVSHHQVQAGTLSDYGLDVRYAKNPQHKGTLGSEGDYETGTLWELALDASVFSGLRYRAPKIQVVVAEPGFGALRAVQRALAYGNGINANLTVAGAAVNDLALFRDHPINAIHYLTHKAAPLIDMWRSTVDYGDVSAYIRELHAQGYHDVTRKRVRDLAIFSMVASHGTTAYALGVINHVLHGSREVSGLSADMSYATVQWPEFTSYLNGEGVSLQTMVSGRHMLGGWHVSFEKILYGNTKRLEAEVGVSIRNPQVVPLELGVAVRVSRSGRVMVGSQISIPVHRKFSLYGAVKFQGSSGVGLRSSREMGSARAAVSLGLGMNF